jgi:histidinol-phosphate/aromatic aminotransferase/cobyric acid decarboxylase-like protein
MYTEMKAYFTDLISQYPSGLNVQNLLAAKLFRVEESQILVGNGAAELIRALAPCLEGTVGVTYPTFNEYPESLTNCTIVPFIPDGFSYTYRDIISVFEKCDTVLLINPDNPSGNFILPGDILELLEYFKKHNKKFVLDESFVDFCDAGERNSLLRQEILDRFPNLIVIKSLSKSYGIPGIRLGVLACSDESLVKRIRANLSIWNINSFGEYFLQIIGKYIKDYQIACQEISRERARFKARLEAAGLFHVYPSQANYLICKCVEFTAPQLAEYLLQDHDIFIKDLTGKKGIPDASYIRLAVRSKDDNEKLIEKLRIFRKDIIQND